MTKQRIVGCIALLLVCCLAACKGPGGKASESTVKPETEDQKTLYALGLMLGGNVSSMSLTPEELAFVKAGLTDAASGAKPQVELEIYGGKVSGFAAKKAADVAAPEKKKGQEFAEGVAKEKGATKTPDGIVIRTITEGSGSSPAASDRVKVHYEGKLIDGTVFDSSIKRDEPAEFLLNEVVPCWTQAVQTMKKGGKAQVVCPSDMAYGDRGRPSIPPGATLSFEIELLDFRKAKDGPFPQK
jgi:FKBP-type peptidyl-prolyl cis-trans isomerase FkpA